MTDLAGFLLARIAEDEADAPMSHPMQWRPKGSDEPWSTATGPIPVGVPIEFQADIGTLVVDRHVLAECEAKRRIVELHCASTGSARFCVGCWEAGGEDGAPSFPCKTLRLLALPYADHEDYRPEWRP